ncbi:MAG: GNAT family N-acetyltransferase [Lachnospiraceae bacterium]|nr:GNAT family N-acetyltransferase [Lachnospiraceae bacterium]
MKIAEEQFTLQDGRTVTIRSAEERDAEAMLAYVRKTSEETHYLIRYPEEISFTLEQEHQIIGDILRSEDSAWLTVFDGDRAVGNCSISRCSGQLKVRHRCNLAIALEQAYCGLGLGTKLLSKARDTAKELGFEQLELGVYADNERAIAAYKKAGFREYGRLPRAFRLKDGTYIDEINMVLFL